MWLSNQDKTVVDGAADLGVEGQARGSCSYWQSASINSSGDNGKVVFDPAWSILRYDGQLDGSLSL